MSLKLILYLIAISGIFKKDNDLDILPPPPPFPEIGMDDKAEEEELKRKEKEETRKEKELKERRKEFKKEIREKELEKKRILREKISKKKHNSRKKQVFNFFHSLGLVKTEKEKKEIELQREKRKEFEKSRKEIRDRELRKQKELKLKEQEAKRKEDEEKRRIANLVGPHKDDFIFLIDNVDLKKYGSQGQHKTFQIALRFAEFFYLKQLTGKTPIFLLDDVFGKLDSKRAQKISNYLRKVGQAFITVTDLADFSFLDINNEDTIIKVNEGVVEYAW